MLEDHSHDFQRKKKELLSIISSHAIMTNFLKQQIEILTKELNKSKKMNSEFDENILNVNKVNNKLKLNIKILKIYSLFCIFAEKR